MTLALAATGRMALGDGKGGGNYPQIPDANEQPVMVQRVKLVFDSPCPPGITEDEIQQSVDVLDGAMRTREEIETVLSKAADDCQNRGYAGTRFRVDENLFHNVLVVHVIPPKVGAVTVYAAVEQKKCPCSLATTQPANPLDFKPTDALWSARLKSMVSFWCGDPLNVNRLEALVGWLGLNPNVVRIDATVTETEQKETDEKAKDQFTLNVNFEVTETHPYSLKLAVDNFQNPAVGPERVQLLGSDTNLIGDWDTFSFRYGIITGGFEDTQWAGTNDFSLAYDLPVGPTGLAFDIGFDRTNEPLVEPPLNQLDLNSRDQTVTIGIREPIPYTVNDQLEFSLYGNYETNTTTLFGQPFGLTPDLGDGHTSASVIRFGQGWIHHDKYAIWSVISKFNFGIDALGATTAPQGQPSGQFFSWQGQASGVDLIQLLADARFVWRASAQLTPDRLLALEKAALGGFDTVRSYSEAQFLTENQAVASVELQWPVPWGYWASSDVSSMPFLAIGPFADVGYGWDRDKTNYPILATAGIGLQLNPCRAISALLYYGAQLNHIEQVNRTLQSDGLYFSVVFTY